MTRLSSVVSIAATIALAACAGGDRPGTDSADSGAAVGAPAGAPAGTMTDTGPARPDSGPTRPTSPTSSGMTDPNSASREQIAAVPGMSPQAADALVAARPFENMLAVDRALAAALPDTTARKNVYNSLWIPVDLNKASREELLLIPGVGRKMAHEFEEYRPYRDMARFRREIGKYVDAQEVARLERFFAIR